jgi:hypothetical protein
MRRLRILALRLRSLLRGETLEDELDRELRLHLDALTQEHLASGMSEAEARLAARRAFGSTALVKDQCCDQRRTRRLLTVDDEKLDPPVAVISHGYWQRRFGGAADVIGRTLTSGDRVYTIVGVTPPEFWGLIPGREVLVTLPINRGSRLVTDAGAWWFEAVGRVRPGAGVAAARRSSASGWPWGPTPPPWPARSTARRAASSLPASRSGCPQPWPRPARRKPSSSASPRPIRGATCSGPRLSRPSPRWPAGCPPGAPRSRRRPTRCAAGSLPDLPDAALAGAGVAAAALGARPKGGPAAIPAREPTLSRRTIVGSVHAQHSAPQLAAVELRDRGRRQLRCRELDESEPARAAAVSVGRDRDVDHLADGREQLAQLVDLGVEAEIADEDFCRNGVLLSCFPAPR